METIQMSDNVVCRCPKCTTRYEVRRPNKEQMVTCTCPACGHSFEAEIYGEE